MTEPIHTSRITITRDRGPIRIDHDLTTVIEKESP